MSKHALPSKHSSFCRRKLRLDYPNVGSIVATWQFHNRQSVYAHRFEYLSLWDTWLVRRLANEVRILSIRASDLTNG